METVASADWGLDRVRKVRKSEMPVPSAKYHTFSKPGKAAVAWPSAMLTMAGSKERLKYMARSTTTPWAASVDTTTPKPRDTGSDTLRPIPPASAALNTSTVSRELAPTTIDLLMGG